MSAYYNEFDVGTAAWLRQLIKQGLIADGIVDERSIIDVQASDLTGFTQCHFFAGIGGWSYALRLSNWADNRPVWTASLPCQPFSIAGNQKGKDDERHLLPHFLELVRQCRPDTIIGEQVEGAIRHGWLDDLQAVMEAEGYAVGAIILGAHSVRSPHIRQRLYWVASGLSNTSGKGLQRHWRPDKISISKGWQGKKRYDSESSTDNGVGNTHHDGRIASEKQGGDATAICSSQKRENCTIEPEGTSSSRTLSSNWDNPDWLWCRDNKYRPILAGLKSVLPTKPRSAKVADGLPAGVVLGGDTGAPINADETQEARVIRLRGYGNAIVPKLASEFIKSFMAVSA